MASRINVPEYTTFDQLHDHLGDVPLSRILMKPAPGTATEDDLVRPGASRSRLCELIDGTLVEKPMGSYESRVGMFIGRLLDTYAERHDLGVVLGPDALVRVEPGQVRMPDASFFSWDQFPGDEVPTESVWDYVPRMTVEVLSESNTKKEMERKRKEFFRGGCRLVWEIDPRKREVEVYTTPDQSMLLREKGTLDGGDVLPGFKLSVAALFTRAKKRKKRS